ncbi:DUF4276 family protein [Actinoplanes sp. NBRC 101535]|uniref:DUF4276 family protein n=1 Tax=Actinoplanes sp. NBRC 101535 TaxID=3032196 RepID=UPI0024A07FD4|nr:DUF4276 family protein [Actinoplanes sp. NBRC 101535]GLY03669.1 hypothetical protein Acsp01_40480 [Actinoplanes sp. NBRC 101535]
MRFLTSALIAEGSSDDRFLPFLLRRSLEDVCATDFADDVDVDQVTVLRRRQRPPTVPEIIGVVEANADTFHLVFVHRDQDGNTDRVRREWLDPLAEAWGTSRPERWVPVVPVRKSEAWVLADGNALRSVLGVRWADADLGVPGRPRDVERIGEPKVPIRRLVDRLGRPIEDFYEELAEAISLDVLTTVPSFLAVRECTVRAIADLGYRPRRGRTS